MLSTASRSAPRARALHSRRASLACATCQQRAFRFRPWNADGAENDSKSEAKKCRSSFRYRYMESVRSKWGLEPGATDVDPALVEATELLKQSMGPKGPKHINIEKNHQPDDVPGTRPGRNIEDVERDAINHLFESHSGHAKAHHDIWSTPLRNIRNMLHAEQAPKDATPNEVLDATTTAAEIDEGQIDPITNRRISRAKRDSSTFTPKFEDVDHHPNLQTRAPKEKYEKVQWNEPEGLPRVTREEESKRYEDLDKYKSQKWNEPDGLPKETREELTKNYTDLGQYGAARWNEPDGLQKPTPEELSKDYHDLGSYGQMKWNEPDGLSKLTPEEESKAYDDLDTYDGPRTTKDSVIRDYEATQMDPTVKGNELPPKVEIGAEEPGKEYTDLGEYKAVYWNEPDGLRKLTPEELSKHYDDLHLYAQAKRVEPDGLLNLSPEEALKEFQDLGSYGAVRWNEPDGLPLPTPEELSKKYKDLDAYRTPMIDGVDKPYLGHPDEAAKQYADLASYSSTYGSKTEHVHPEELTKNYSDLDRYDPQNFDSPVPAEASSSGEASNSYSDLGSYTQRSQPQGISSTGACGKSLGNDGQDGENGSKLDHLTANEIRANVLRRARKQSLGKEQHRQATAAAFQKKWDPIMKDAHEKLAEEHPRKMTGNFVRDFPEEFATSWSTTRSPSQSTLLPKDQAAQYENEREVEPSSMDESFPSESSRLEPALDRHARRNSAAQASQETRTAKFEEAVREAQEDLVAEKYTSKRTPERWPAPDYSNARTERWAPDSRFEDAIKEAEEKLVAQQSVSPTLPKSSSAAEPSTSKPEPLTSEATFQQAVKEAEEKFAAQQSSSRSFPAVRSDKPIVYKILAYDPTTDLIRTAETSSGVHDTSSPLTPADVIPKLSNPAKFFVHFSGLQAQGYEIVSGERDVLVFRKARSPPSSTPKFENPSRVNPIDMMGKPPITGNFASPTGFVNYDSLEEANPKPEPPFRSNTSVRREEPVYSRPKETTGMGKEKKTRGLGTRMIIGTAYVAGGAYAVGVMGEYFATRGAPPRPGVEPVKSKS